MKRLIFLIGCFYVIHANAQSDIQLSKAFSAGLDLGIPSNSIYTIGLGATGKVEIPVVSPVSLIITGGYAIFFYKGNLYESSRTPSPATFIPLKAGVKYNFNGGAYIEGELGTSIETNYLKQNLFAFSIGPGFTIPLNNNRGIDIGFRYENWSNHQLRQTAITVAYRLGW